MVTGTPELGVQPNSDCEVVTIIVLVVSDCEFVNNGTKSRAFGRESKCVSDTLGSQRSLHLSEPQCKRKRNTTILIPPDMV